MEHYSVRLAVTVVAAVGVFFICFAPPMRAFTLDTPMVIENTHAPSCTFANTSLRGDCTLAAGSGLYISGSFPPLPKRPSSASLSAQFPLGGPLGRGEPRRRAASAASATSS